MSAEKEITKCVETKISYRSYYAFIPFFKGRRESNTEKHIIQLIHKSNIFNSNPLLKALLIENVRITCIVIESSSKQSVKIICASAPYILTLISKANPKFENFLKNEKISSCLNILHEKDFEYVLSNVYHATIILHNGVKKLYATVYVDFLRNSIPHSEKVLLYLMKLTLNVLGSGAEFLSDNFTLLFRYLRQQNCKFFTYIVDNLPVLIASFIKYGIIATENTHRIIFVCVKYLRNFVLTLIHFLNDYSNSALCNELKKLHLFLKLSLSYLRKTNAYYDIKQVCLHLLSVIKPHLYSFFAKFFEILKLYLQLAVPLVKDTVHIAIKEAIPYVRQWFCDNWEIISKVCNTAKYFLFENMHYIKPFCCHTCHLLYNSICHVYEILQTILPRAFQFSSDAIVNIVTFSKYILEHLVYFCKVLLNHIITSVESKKQHFCRLSKVAINILKEIFEIILKAQPYMVLFCRFLFNELSKMIHVFSPTLIPCMHEINSSLFHASKEIVGKSCLVVKRVTPSFYYSIVKIVPPTLLAIHELLKSSKNSVVIISPAVLKFALKIHPEIIDGFIILFSDGNKACVEVITVSCSASCQIKDAAITVSSNLPVLCKAVHTVLITTAYATIEVTDKSLKAKTRVIKDIRKARRVVQTSFVLAEQEVVTVCNDFICEINAYFPKSKKSEGGKIIPIGKYINQIFYYIFSSFVKQIKIMTNKLDGPAQSSVVCIQNSSKLFLKALLYAFFLVYTSSIDTMKPGVLKINEIHRKCFTSLRLIFAKMSSVILLKFSDVWCHMLSCILSGNVKIIEHLVTYVPEVWRAFKSNVSLVWNKFCLFTPECWLLIEYLASTLWNYIVKCTPCAWNAWKKSCLASWKLTQDLTPYIWKHSSSTISVLWPSARLFTKQTWCLFTSASSVAWQQAAFLTSEYWLLSKTYLPQFWSISCKETRTTWIATCFLIESCYSITVESCSLSWNFLQCTVSKSWRSGVVFTKTAYYMFTTTGSALLKSFCMCSKTKKYVCIILKSTPRISNFSLNSFQIKKLRRISYSNKK